VDAIAEHSAVQTGMRDSLGPYH